MTQKQLLSVVVGLIVMLVVVALISVPFMQNQGTKVNQPSSTIPKTMQRPSVAAPVPAKLDDITSAITAESTDDLSALDQETVGAIGEIDADTDSVNNLGTSYDENSF